MKSRLDPGYAMLVIALVLGAATRLFGLMAQSIYVDEAHTFLIASTTLPKMLTQIASTDYHPPLFYVIAHFLSALHLQHEAYRYFTAPIALVTIAATWAIARRLFSPVAAGVAAIVIAIDPSAIMWERIFRMYVLLNALVALSWWLLMSAEEARGARRNWLWVAFAVCAIVQPYVHYLGILNVACQAIYGLSRLRTAWPAAASAAASAVAFLWWLPYALQQLPGGGLVAGTASVPIQWWTLARDAVLAGTPLGWIRAPAFDIVVTVLVVAMSVWAAWSARRSILPFWLLVAVLQIVLSVVSGKFLAAPRYLLPVLPLFAMGVGLVVDRHLLLPKVRIASFAVGGAVLALLAFCTTNVLFDPLYQFPDWNLVQTIFRQNARPGDVIVFDQGYTVQMTEAYSTYDYHRVFSITSPSSVDMVPKWLLYNAERRVWYIENQYYYVDPDRAVISEITAVRPQVGEWLEPRVELSNRVYVALFGAQRRPHTGAPRHAKP